jgi:hypothetical protein
MQGLQLLLWNVQDRDFRDILFDHRVTSAGREFQHAYFTQSWLSTSDQRWPDPELATQLSQTVPVMLLECDDGLMERCLVVLMHVQAAMGLEPTHCSRRGGLMWSAQALYTYNSGTIRIRFFADGQELNGHQLTVADKYASSAHVLACL